MQAELKHLRHYLAGALPATALVTALSSHPLMTLLTLVSGHCIIMALFLRWTFPYGRQRAQAQPFPKDMPPQNVQDIYIDIKGRMPEELRGKPASEVLRIVEEKNNAIVSKIVLITGVPIYNRYVHEFLTPDERIYLHLAQAFKHHGVGKFDEIHMSESPQKVR